MEQKEHIIPKIEVSFYPKRNPTKRVFIKCSQDSYRFLRTIWDMNTISLFEEFIVLFLDRRSGIIGWRKIGQGSTSGVVVNVQLIFGIATQCNTSAIIVAHNHPSANLKPSHQDKNITQRIRDGCKLFDIKLLDHLILTEESYYSFADEGDI